MVQQRLYHAKTLLELAPTVSGVQSQLALCNATAFNLVHAYRLYLSEFNWPSVVGKTYSTVSELLSQSLTITDREALLELERFEGGVFGEVSLAYLNWVEPKVGGAVESAVGHNDSLLASDRSSAPDMSIELVERCYNLLIEITQRQRSNRSEY